MDTFVRLELWIQFLDWNFESSCYITIVDSVFVLEFWTKLVD